ncbi:MAG: T9SS type A sorting domain-containing protein [Bacteroidetes bacterium]|nr:T9SS type A sorting domain-containing protein [Bacteroidota bacterium]
MSWPSRSLACALACALLLLLSARLSHAQWFTGSLKDSANQADYLIVSVPEYAGSLQPLAAYRADQASLATMIVMMDSIVSQFPRWAPDSSIRDFVTWTLTHWTKPAPQFLLLAGNVNTIPSHKTVSMFSEYYGEDSVMIDQWFANQGTESDPGSAPEMAVGRFPAWTQGEMEAMVSKTLAYEEAPFENWTNRVIVVADSTDFQTFEADGSLFLSNAASHWPDTLSVHVRDDSPWHKSKAEFLDLWNTGSAIVSFFGHARGPRFSRASYFTSSDVDSLANGTPLPLVFFEASQRFENPDTLPMSAALLRRPDRGGVCVIAPSGLMYSYPGIQFTTSVVGHLSTQPLAPIGMAWHSALQSSPSSISARWTLLGDPALVIKSRGPASNDDPPAEMPLGYALDQNFPNPFNPSTTIQYAIPRATFVRLSVFNILGQQVAMLQEGVQAAGYHQVEFDGAHVSSGVYYYRIETGSFIAMKKMMLVK